MTDLQSISIEEQNVEEAINSLKRWSHLLRYGRLGKPKFCPFRISNDETTLIWYVRKEEKQLPLSQVSKIIPGQRTALFQRYPQPEKEYQSFSLLYGNRSLDVICKDKGEAETWFVALQALISRNNCQISKGAVNTDSIPSDSSSSHTRRKSQSVVSNSSSDIVFEDSGKNETSMFPIKNTQNKNLGRAFSDMLMYTESEKYSRQNEYFVKSYGLPSTRGQDDYYRRRSADSTQLSSYNSISSSQGSHVDDVESLHDVFIWGEGTGDGLLGGGVQRIGNSSSARTNALLPKALKSIMAFDARKVACGSRHAVVVTKQQAVYSWGEGLGGRLGHGVEADVSTPKLISDLSSLNIESVACGENHTCAVTQAGELYTWGDGIHNSGLLGHGTEASNWTPKKVGGKIESMHISFISCGPCHSAAVTSEGLLFTFGDGTFGALGHGNSSGTYCPRAVEALKGLRTFRVSCGVWHTAAIVEVDLESSTSCSSSARKLFTWGNGDEGQLGHKDRDPRFFPSCVLSLYDENFCQVACGHSMTVALTTLGQVYTMGSAAYGQLGSPENAGNLPLCIEGNLKDSCIEEISCGSHHVAVLSSKSEVYTWGKGSNGQLGHGDSKDRNIPTLVGALGETQVKSVVCGSNVTAAVCLRKQLSTADLPICSGCQAQFSYKRKRHNCYNCGLVFCKPCCSKKSSKAALAPNMDKPYRVCEDCYYRLHKEETDTKSSYLPPKVNRANTNRRSGLDNDYKSSDQKSQGLLSRLSSFDSFRRSGNQQPKPDSSQESGNSYALSPQRSFQREYSYASNSSTYVFDPGRLAASLPGSLSSSRATSPVSVKSSPNRSTSISSTIVSPPLPESKGDDSKRKNDNLNKEISVLREQVEYLLQKTQILESELKTTSLQLKEATKQARDEEEKNKAAKEEINSLTTQSIRKSLQDFRSTFYQKAIDHLDIMYTIFSQPVLCNARQRCLSQKLSRKTRGPIARSYMEAKDHVSQFDTLTETIHYALHTFLSQC